MLSLKSKIDIIINKVMKIYEQNDTKERVLNEAKRLLKSGAIDIDKYLASNDYSIAKVLLYVIFTNLSKQYIPFSKDLLEEANNLFSF